MPEEHNHKRMIPGSRQLHTQSTPVFTDNLPSARMCPDIAASSWDLVAPLFKLSVVSRAYTLKKYLWGLPGGGQGPL